ncbi:MAG: 3-deoxy-D-manno-octulosonic acid transferase [Gemmatimonadota bacterium]|nr:3-deoxy-D-manno-octulosonic acid transferase [Gemmatimonadota bacterium]
MTGQIRNLVLGLGFALHLLRKRLATGAWRTDARTRDGRIGDVPRRAPGPRILVHGVSVGETSALEPLADALASSRLKPDVVVSASTETGFARARRIHEGRREVVRFPLDFTWMVDRFLDGLRPDLVVLAELELWPTFLASCGRRGIPVCVVNGRMSARSFRGYRMWRLLARRMFSRLALVAAQTEVYRERFAAMGVPRERTLVTGSLKWDAALRAPDATAARRLAADMGIDPSRPLIVAGSTGPGEEAVLLRDLPGGCQLLLAPRSPDRWDEVARLRPGMMRRSAPLPGDHDVFLLDTIGELADAYLLADFVFVGRSLGPMGGSNPLESVALGKPTVIGPHHENFAGVVADLAEAGGLAVSAEPMRLIGRWLDDPAAAAAVATAGLHAVERNRGTAGRTAERVLYLLDGPASGSTSVGRTLRGTRHGVGSG